jgi:hypothetical protein
VYQTADWLHQITMFPDDTKQQVFSGKAMTSSQFATQDTADEHTHSSSVTCDDKTVPMTLNTTALVSETRSEAPDQYTPDNVQHGLPDVVGSTTHSTEFVNVSHLAQATAATDVNDDELMENGNGLFPGGRTADEQNLEVDVCPASVPKQGFMLCHTIQTLTLR